MSDRLRWDVSIQRIGTVRWATSCWDFTIGCVALIGRCCSLARPVQCATLSQLSEKAKASRTAAAAATQVVIPDQAANVALEIHRHHFKPRISGDKHHWTICTTFAGQGSGFTDWSHTVEQCAFHTPHSNLTRPVAPTAGGSQDPQTKAPWG